MASSKVMPSTSNSTNSDLNSLSSHHHHHHSHHHHHHHHLNHPSPSQMISDFTSTTSDLQQRMNVEGIMRDVYVDNPPESATNTLLDAEVTLIDTAGAISTIGNSEDTSIRRQNSERKTVEDVWREIVSGKNERKECKVEAPDEMMTLEDFLAKAGAGMEGDEQEEEDVKIDVLEEIQMSEGVFAFDHSLVQCSYPQQPAPMAAAMGGVMGYGNGGGGGSMEVLGGVRGKRRGGPILEPLDKAAQQRQRRMIKNRESAARSRERKQVESIPFFILFFRSFFQVFVWQDDHKKNWGVSF